MHQLWQAQPQDAGFDYWFATQNNAAPSHKNPVNFIRNGVELGPIEGFSCQIVTNEAIKWMEDHVKQNEKQPFFIYLSFHEPHEPIASPKKIVDTYKEIAERLDLSVKAVEKRMSQALSFLRERLIKK